MPSNALTPESLMARADSKNPATTCMGLTTSGRPCRRALGASARNSPTSSPGRGGVIAVSTGGQDAAAFYCWQHKDQAEVLAEKADNGVQVVDLRHKSSVDSLAARLGIMNVGDARRKHGRANDAKGRADYRRTSATGAGGYAFTPKPQHSGPRPSPPNPAPRRKQRERSNLHVSLFCCMRTPEVDDEEAPVPVRPVTPAQRVPSYRAHSTPTVQRVGNSPGTLLPPSPLAYLPPAGQPATLALLSKELAKPLSASDHDPGHIYIFWVVPANSGTPASSDATGLLAPPRSARPQTSRHASELLRQYSVRAPPRQAGEGERRTIMLKIGRTVNVQQRMYAWKRQCGEDIMLLRSYPYQSVSSSAASSPAPSHRSRPAAGQRRASMPPSLSTQPSRKVPLMPRVERLIHLELQEQRVMRQCTGCNKQHREWFEVAASMAGVRAVDETIRRWVEWAERTAESAPT